MKTTTAQLAVDAAIALAACTALISLFLTINPARTKWRTQNAERPISNVVY